jgi:hypothetical protein
VLRIRLSELIRTDSYGVHGSEFYVCRLCDRESGAGVLNKGIQHPEWCPVGRYELRVAKRMKLVSPDVLSDEQGVVK